MYILYMYSVFIYNIVYILYIAYMYMYFSFPNQKSMILKVDSNEITCFLEEIKLNRKLLCPSTYLAVSYACMLHI